MEIPSPELSREIQVDGRPLRPAIVPNRDCEVLAPVPPGPEVRLISTLAVAAFLEGSRLLNPDRTPLVLWRGDGSPVRDFNQGQRYNPGIFLAAERARAHFYKHGTSSCLRPFYVRSVKPLDLRDPTQAFIEGPSRVKEVLNDLFDDHFRDLAHPEKVDGWTMDDMLGSLEAGDLWRAEGGWSMSAWKGLQRSAQNAGFDSLVVPDGGEGVGAGTSVVVWDSRQLKHASENSGGFDRQNPDIYC